MQHVDEVEHLRRDRVARVTGGLAEDLARHRIDPHRIMAERLGLAGGQIVGALRAKRGGMPRLER